MIFSDILTVKDGMIKGPFGGDVKKSLFVEKANDTYKVYEQSVVAENDYTIGNYYLPKKYVEKKLHRFLIKPGDILLTGAGTLGLLSIVPDGIEEGIINQALIRIRLNESVIYKPYFMYYFPWYIKRVAVRLNGDSVIPNLPPLSVLKKIEIDIPPIAEQQKIADFLSKIDEAIQKNENTIRLSERLMREIYDYWFVQFDFPDENGRPYKSSGGEMVYDETLKREIPKGWSVKRVDELCEVKTGKEDANFSVPDGDYKFFTCADEPLRCNTPCFSGKSILIAGNGNFNVKHYDGNFNAYQRTYVLQPDDEFYGITFIEAKNKTELFTKGSNGSIVKFITKGDVGSIYVLTSPRAMELYETFNTILAEIDVVQSENEKLASLRDWLLPMLMNGQIKIAD